MKAQVALGEIPPESVRVQMVFGSVSGDGTLGHGSSSDMAHTGVIGSEHQDQGELECRESGSYRFSVRVVPYHPDVRVPFEHPWLVWAE